MTSKVEAIDESKLAQAQDTRPHCSNHVSASPAPDVFDSIDIKGFGAINDEKSIFALRTLLRLKVTAALAKNTRADSRL